VRNFNSAGGIQITDSLTNIAVLGFVLVQTGNKAVILGCKIISMDNIRRFETVNDYNVFNNNETLHPLVSVIDLSKANPRKASNMYFGFYTVFLKQVDCGNLRYGRHTYDYQEGTLVFIAPGQVISVDNPGEAYQPKGYALVFHEDLIHGTALGKHIQEYSFFSYQSNEALHLSEREKRIVLDCYSKIEYELEHAIDKHSKSYLQIILNYY
jgi:AraC family transcriptional regulator, transcriptional activator of pobA